MDDVLSKKRLLGIAIGFIALTPLTTAFSLFHVDLFLTAYELPLASYAVGNAIYAFINTANDVGGAWLVDSLGQKTDRSRILSITGILFAFCFLTLFFRFDKILFGSTSSIPSSWPLIHFVLSMSLYDTMYSFSAILTGSIFTDKLLPQNTKVKFLAFTRFSGMILSFAIAKIGLNIFDAKDLTLFQIYVVILAILTAALFHASQVLSRSTSMSSIPSKTTKDKGNESCSIKKKKLNIKTALHDLSHHKNFQRWIFMEMFLECQVTFISSFSKLFVDRLLFVHRRTTTSTGFSRENCDWILSIMGPLGQVTSLFCFYAIAKVGYHKIYLVLFRLKFISAILMLLFATPSDKSAVCFFLIMSKVVTGAVQGSGFTLAMADMVTEMKYIQIKQDRMNESSLAGMFMGANALMCKPMDSLLPIIAAWGLDRAGFAVNLEEDSGAEISNAEQWTLFYLLIGPSLIFSPLQHYIWDNYDLSVDRVQMISRQIKEKTTEIFP